MRALPVSYLDGDKKYILHEQSLEICGSLEIYLTVSRDMWGIRNIFEQSLEICGGL